MIMLSANRFLIACHIAYILLGLGFVVPIIKAWFDELDKSLIEVSLDLGASSQYTFLYLCYFNIHFISSHSNHYESLWELWRSGLSIDNLL